MIMPNNWMKLLPFFMVEWVAKRYCARERDNTLANVGKRFWITDKMEVRLLCERCDAPTTKVIIDHQKVVSEKEVECDCGEDIYDDDDGY
jgi:hypothetical protein